MSQWSVILQRFQSFSSEPLPTLVSLFTLNKCSTLHLSLEVFFFFFLANIGLYFLSSKERTIPARCHLSVWCPAPWPNFLMEKKNIIEPGFCGVWAEMLSQLDRELLTNNLCFNFGPLLPRLSALQHKQFQAGSRKSSVYVTCDTWCNLSRHCSARRYLL